jgi:uncharacterized protein YndB with AHSA1/START domain
MEHGSIEREIYVEASPDVVFDVVSQPAHMREWWSVEADHEPEPGAVGELVWGERTHVEHLLVVEVDRPRLFSFRWVFPDGDVTGPRSLLVTFELKPSGDGTTLRVTESGFREMGWETAVLEAAYQDHVNGWDEFVPRLGAYAATLVLPS